MHHFSRTCGSQRTVRQPLERLLNVKMPLLAPLHRSLNDTSSATGNGLLLQQTAQRPDTPHGRSVYISSMPPGTSKESVRAAVAAALPQGVGFVVSVEMKQRSNMMPYAFVELSSLQAAYELVLNHAHRLLLGQQELKVQFKKIGLASPESSSGTNRPSNTSAGVPLQPFAGDGHSVFEICHMVSIKLARDFGLPPPATPTLCLSDAVGGSQTSENGMETVVKGTNQQVKAATECSASPVHELLVQPELPERKRPNVSMQTGLVSCCRQVQELNAADNSGDTRSRPSATFERQLYVSVPTQHASSKQKLQCPQQQQPRGAQGIKCNTGQGGSVPSYEGSPIQPNLEQRLVLQHPSIPQPQLLLLQNRLFHPETTQLQALCRDGPLIATQRHSQSIVEPNCLWENVQALSSPQIHAQSPEHPQVHSLLHPTLEISGPLQAMQAIQSIPDSIPQHMLQHVAAVSQVQYQQVSKDYEETREQPQTQRDARFHLNSNIWKENLCGRTSLRLNDTAPVASITEESKAKEDLDDGMTPLAGVYTPRSAAEAVRSETWDFAEAQVCDVKAKQQDKQQQSLPPQVWRRGESLGRHNPSRNITKASPIPKEHEEHQMQEPACNINGTGFQGNHSEVSAFLQVSNASGVPVGDIENPRMHQISLSKVASTGQRSQAGETERLQEVCNFMNRSINCSSSTTQVQEHPHQRDVYQEMPLSQHDLGIQRQQVAMKQRHQFEQDGSTFKRELEELMGIPPTSHSDCGEPHLQFTHTPHLGRLIKLHAQQQTHGDGQCYRQTSHIGFAEAQPSVSCSLENFSSETYLTNASTGPMQEPFVASQETIGSSVQEAVEAPSETAASLHLLSAGPNATGGGANYEVGTSHEYAGGSEVLLPQGVAGTRSLEADGAHMQEKKNRPENTLPSNNLLCKTSEHAFEENLKLRFFSRLSSMALKNPSVCGPNAKNPVLHSSSSATGSEPISRVQGQQKDALVRTIQLPSFAVTSQTDLQTPQLMQEQTRNVSLKNETTQHNAGHPKPTGDKLVQESGTVAQDGALRAFNGSVLTLTSETSVSNANSTSLIPSIHAPTLPTGKVAAFTKLSLANARDSKQRITVPVEDAAPGLDRKESVDLKLNFCLQVSGTANVQVV